MGRWMTAGAVTLCAATMVCSQWRDPVVSTVQPTNPGAIASRETPIVRVVREVGPTVVNLYTEMRSLRSTWFGQRWAESGSLGAGVIVHPSGIVVTNAHVITGQLQDVRDVRIKVNYRPDWSGTSQPDEVADVEEYSAVLLGFDASNDLALLKIKADRDFPAATLGTSSDLMIGETVVAVGNPYGREGSVTHGIISGTHRDLEVRAGVEFDDLIQTDAPLNAGNSGGPLFNIVGELIGINQAIGADARLGRAEGQGLAIPIDRVRSLLATQFSPFEAGDVFLGAGVRDDGAGAVLLTDVVPNGPAARAGLRDGARVLDVEGFPVEDTVAFNLSVLSRDRSVPLTLRVDDQGVTRSAKVELLDIEETVQRRLGLRLRPHPDVPQLMVTGVLRDGPGDEVGVREDDFLLELAGRKVRTYRDAFEAILSREPEEDVGVVVRRYTRRDRFGWSDPKPFEGTLRLR